MINRASIIQWSKQVPWNDNAQIEQDLIISRALVAIFSDEFLSSQLAFRGGTALHKLYLSPVNQLFSTIKGIFTNPSSLKCSKQLISIFNLIWIVGGNSDSILNSIVLL